MADGHAPVVATERTLVEIDVARFDPDPGNPRRLPVDSPELLAAALVDITSTIEVDSDGAPINGRGILDALKARRRDDDRFALVDGERRWRAAVAKGLRRVLCEIVVLSDEEVLELQLRAHGVELTPLEEARGFARLRAVGQNEATIAERCAKTPRHVARRLVLLTLVEEAQAMIVPMGPISVELAVDRLAGLSADSQRAAVVDLRRVRVDGDEPLTRREVKEIIERRRLQLVGAGFALDDADLVPAAGACIRCPKRSGTQAVLYADAVTDQNLCGDRVCFDGKRAAHLARLKADAKKSGVAVIDHADEVKKIFPYGHGQLPHGSPFIDLDHECPEVSPPRVAEPKTLAPDKRRRGGPEKCMSDGSDGEHDFWKTTEAAEEPEHEAAKAGCSAWELCDCDAWEETVTEAEEMGIPKGWKAPTWEQALTQALGKAPAPAMVVQDPNGKPRRLFDRKGGGDALKRAGMIKAPERPETEAPKKKPGQLEAWQVDQRAAEIATREARETIADKAARKKVDVAFWRLLAGLILADRALSSTLAGDAASRRRAEGAKKPEGRPADELRAWVAKQKDEGVVRGLVVELLTADTYGDECQLAIGSRFFGVDLAALKKAAATKIRADAKAKAKKAEEKKTKAAKPAKGAGAVTPAPVSGKAVACPVKTCKAKPGAGCTDSRGMSLPLGRVHKERTEAALQASLKTSPTPAEEEEDDRDDSDPREAPGPDDGPPSERDPEDPHGLLAERERGRHAPPPPVSAGRVAAMVPAVAKACARSACTWYEIRDELRGKHPAASDEERDKAIDAAIEDGSIVESNGTPERGTTYRAADAPSKPKPSAPAESPCPLDVEAVVRLSKAAGVSADTIERVRQGACGWISPEAVWHAAQGLFAHVEKAHPAEVTRAALFKAFDSAGEDCVDVALALLVGERKLHRLGKAKGEWRYALKQPALPGQAGEGRPCKHCGCKDSQGCIGDVGPEGSYPPAAPAVCHLCAHVGATILDLCAKPQTETQIVKAKALRMYGSAEGQRRLAKILLELREGGRLVAKGDKLVAAKA